MIIVVFLPPNKYKHELHVYIYVLFCYLINISAFSFCFVSVIYQIYISAFSFVLFLSSIKLTSKSCVCFLFVIFQTNISAFSFFGCHLTNYYFNVFSFLFVSVIYLINNSTCFLYFVYVIYLHIVQYFLWLFYITYCCHFYLFCFISAFYNS